jgi:hypothetical protein
MTIAKFLKDRVNRVAIPCLCLRGCLDEPVGHAAHGGDHHHHVTLARSLANDFDDFADAGCVADRRPAKLHDSKWPLHCVYGV